MNIEIVVSQLTVQPKPILIIGGSNNYVNAIFRFDSDWDGLSKTVTFYTSNAAYDVLLVSDTCEVPHELLVGGNEIFITISGYGDKTIRTKSMLKGMKVYLEGTYQGTTPGAYSPELWEQVLSQINQKQDKISAVDINDKNHLIITLSNGGIMDAGEIDVDTAVDKNIKEKLMPELEKKQDKAITDEGAYFDSDTVEGALQELGEALDKFTYVSPTVTLSVGGANSTEELGKVLSSVTVSATANKECKSLKLYSGSTLLQSAEKATSVSATVENVSTTTTFKAVATDKYDKNIQKTSTISFYNGIYYGVASDGVSISELSKRLQGNNNCEFSGNAGVGQYFFFASPKRYGTPSFKDKDTGFGADFTLVDGNVAFTNASGYEEAYQLYRSTHPALGQTTITVY